MMDANSAGKVGIKQLLSNLFYANEPQLLKNSKLDQLTLWQMDKVEISTYPTIDHFDENGVLVPKSGTISFTPEPSSWVLAFSAIVLCAVTRKLAGS